jgi:hypothetical protein
MFKARGKTGHLAQLASCIVLAPAQEDAAGGGGAAATAEPAAPPLYRPQPSVSLKASKPTAAATVVSGSKPKATTAVSRNKPSSSSSSSSGAAAATAAAVATVVAAAPSAATIAAQRAKNLAYVEEMQGQQKALFERARTTTDKALRKEILATISALTKNIALHLEHAKGSA